ncbi:MAG: DUF371 domain-containing protein [Promethearchaeota archaeon]
MAIIDKIVAIGHKNVLSTHKTTLEITKENYLTTKGNCIIGIKASKACIDLNPILKSYIKKGKKFKITIKIGKFIDSFYGYGSNKITLLNKYNIVFRKSNFICDRTVLINCTKSANDLNRNLINKIKKADEKFSILFELADKYDVKR